MSHSRKVPLGVVLQQAGLVSAEQVKEALRQQQSNRNLKNLKIGQILTIQGRIDRTTADFFAERWSSLSQEKQPQPIGQYLKEAGLLNEGQIQTILAEQKRTERKFGELAIAKGWLKQTTLKFFLDSIPSQVSLSSTMKNESRQPIEEVSDINDRNKAKSNDVDIDDGFLKIKRKLLQIEDRDTYSSATLDRVLFWTGGKSSLTQKLFALIAEHQIDFQPGKERKQIDLLVQSKILHNWQNSYLGVHLSSIRERLMNNRYCQPKQLLALYRQILTEFILVDETKEQQELLNLGLVVRQQDRLVVANHIYRSVFNPDWVVATIDNLAQLTLNKQNSAIAAIAKARKTNRLDNLKNILLLLTSIGLSILFLSNLSKRMKVRFAFQTGNKLLQQKSFTAAIAQYDKLLDIDSNYFQAWTNRGYALEGIKEYDRMRESCSTATIIEPTAFYAWNCQGEGLYKLGQYEAAISAFERAIALNKTDPIFLINKSESLSALNRQTASINAIKEAIKILEKTEAVESREKIAGEFAVALTFLGNGYRKQGSYQEAIAAYERAISYTPEYFPAQIGKAISLDRLKQYKAAQQEFESILRNPNLSTNRQAQTWYYLGKVFCSSAQFAQGNAAFDRSIRLNPDDKIVQTAKEQCLQP